MMIIKNPNKSLFFIVLLLSFGFAIISYLYWSANEIDKNILEILAVSLVFINLAVVFIYLLITRKKTREINALLINMETSFNKNIYLLNEELNKTRLFFKNNASLLKSISSEKTEYDKIYLQGKSNQEILFKIEEDLDTLLSNINRNIETSTISLSLTEKLKNNLKKHNNILTNIDYNIINLINEKDNPNGFNLSFIIDNLNEIKSDFQQLSANIALNISDFSNSLVGSVEDNQISLKTVENLIDNVKPLSKDYAKNYQTVKDVYSRFNHSFAGLSQLTDAIKEFSRQLEYFIDNLSKSK